MLTPASTLPSLENNFTDIYNLYHEEIFRYCYKKCGNRDMGEDMMQQTFMNTWACLQRNQTILHMRAFLYRIAHNLFINDVRKKKETSLDELMDVGFEPATDDPWHQTYCRLESEKWFKKMSNMPHKYKQILEHRFIGGLHPSEIAELLGETANTVSVSIYRGLKQLREPENILCTLDVGK